jgi:FkbM family methyltransferase
MVNDVRFQIDTDLDSAIKKMYHGLYQREITSLLKKYLRQGDTFIDVGANIGYISAIGLSLVGKTGEVHSFEPVPRLFKRLLMLQEDNPEYHIYTNNIALGDDECVSRIAVTNLKNIGWNTMVPGLMSEETTGETIDVPVIRLDTYLRSNNINNIRLIKIDTEGYEFPVIKGISGYLRDSKQFPIFIIEIAPTAYSLLNLSLKDFQELMSGLGYLGYTLDGKKPIDLSMLSITTDVLFLHGRIGPTWLKSK